MASLFQACAAPKACTVTAKSVEAARTMLTGTLWGADFFSGFLWKARNARMAMTITPTPISTGRVGRRRVAINGPRYGPGGRACQGGFRGPDAAWGWTPPTGAACGATPDRVSGSR